MFEGASPTAPEFLQVVNLGVQVPGTLHEAGRPT